MMTPGRRGEERGESISGYDGDFNRDPANVIVMKTKEKEVI